MAQAPRKFWMIKGDGPTNHIHETRHGAELEADRLARLHPGIQFFVLEAVACHRRHDIERIALGRPDSRDEIPF